MVTGESAPMRLVLVVTAYLLVLTLASSSPIGTGRGAHRDALLDPLFPHLHPGAPTEQVYGADQPVFDDHRAGPALGAGAGASAAAAGAALTPPMPARAVLLPLAGSPDRLVATDLQLPRAQREAPPDPPPDAA